MPKKNVIYIAFMLQIIAFSSLAADEALHLIQNGSDAKRQGFTRKRELSPCMNGTPSIKAFGLAGSDKEIADERKLIRLVAVTSSKSMFPLGQNETLSIRGLVSEVDLQKLKSSQYTSIFLENAYGKDDSSPAFYEYHLIVSPSVINPSVRIMKLHSCGLTDRHVENIGSFQQLRELSLSSNQLSDECILKAVTALRSLVTLDLSYTDVTNKALFAISQMSLLTHLNLSYNSEISDDGIQYFYDHPRINMMIIKGNKISHEASERLKKTIPTVDYFPG